MINQAQQRAANSWTTRRDEKRRRIDSVRTWIQGPILSPEKIVDALELLVKSGDRVVLEGDNQKQRRRERGRLRTRGTPFLAPRI